MLLDLGETFKIDGLLLMDILNRARRYHDSDWNSWLVWTLEAKLDKRSLRDEKLSRCLGTRQTRSRQASASQQIPKLSSQAIADLMTP
jgi:hypothetical protein